MMREDGYRLRDIGVVVSDMDVYADHLKQAFIKYDIPFFMDHKRSILLNLSLIHISMSEKERLMKSKTCCGSLTQQVLFVMMNSRRYR